MQLYSRMLQILQIMCIKSGLVWSLSPAPQQAGVKDNNTLFHLYLQQFWLVLAWLIVAPCCTFVVGAFENCPQTCWLGFFVCLLLMDLHAT